LSNPGATSQQGEVGHLRRSVNCSAWVKGLTSACSRRAREPHAADAQIVQQHCTHREVKGYASLPMAL